MQQNNTIILIDAPNLAFRMFFAMERTNMRTLSGIPTWATYGFFKAIFDLLDKTKPKAIAAAYDCKEPTFRHKAYDLYKANRPEEMPEELSTQWPYIREGLESFEIPIYELPGYEADDVIGTLAKKAYKEGQDVLILTGDRDAFQLVNDRIKVLVPSKGELKEYGRQEVFDYWGIWPEQVIDFKSLCGDSSDNIPGIKGIGEKTAAKLLTEYGTLDNVFKNIKKIEKKGLQEKIINGEKSAYLSKKLAAIHTDVPININLKDAHLNMPEMDKLVSFLQKFEFNSFIKRLPNVLSSFNEGKAVDIKDTKNLIIKRSEQMKLDIGNVHNNGNIGNISSDPLENLKTPDLEVTTISTESELEKLIKELKDKKFVCIDLETTSTNTMTCEIVGIGLSYFQNEKSSLEKSEQIKACYIPIGHNEGKQLKSEHVLKSLKPILEDSKKEKIAQNCKFEYKILKRHGINLGENIYDTMLASYVSNPDEKHGLKDQAARILGFRMTKIDELIGSGKKQLSMAEVSIEKVAPYSASDTTYTLELAKHYKTNLEKPLAKILEEIENPLVPVLSDIELNGVRIDTKVLKDLSHEITKKVQELEENIFKVAGEPFNINSPQQLGKILFDKLGLENEGKITKSGQYSTDARTLEALAHHDKSGIIENILEYRQLSKLISTYTDSLPEQINKETRNIHCDFNQTITSTGRLSSSNPNLQNIPIKSELGRKIRKAFTTSFDKGFLLSADYSQIELRILAHMSEDPVLIEAFKAGEDIHKRTAMEIYGVSEKKITPEMRSHGKTLNFALIYQQGPFATARQLNISQKEAQDFIKKYFESFKKVKPFFENLLEEAREKGYAETIYGRRRYFKNLNIRNKALQREDERAACNAPLQGTAADIMKLAMLKVYKELKEKEYKSKLILQVHDELVLDVHPKEKDKIEKMVKESMELDQPLKVPLVVNLSWGENWYECG
ncbi:MAG: DNA polymerase I [Candidatus Melainabacteria bacterium]|nr:DNA polymerase I [Candidatus Melainabacteria bacterium]